MSDELMKFLGGMAVGMWIMQILDYMTSRRK
jgi:hypothetical protein